MTLPTPSVLRAMRGHVSQVTRIISERLLRFGLVIAVAGGCFAASCAAQVVQLPLSCEGLRPAERAELNRAFSGIDVCQHMAAGSLTPGETYDLGLPPNRFNREFYRWIEWLNHDERLHAISYEELIQWDRVEKEFERLREWAAKRRQALP